MGNRVTHLHFLGILNTRDDIAYLASSQFLTGNHIHLQHAHLVGNIFLSCIEEFHLITLMDAAVGNLEISNDTTERVKDRVENQRLQRSLLITHGMRDTLNNSVKNIFYTFTCLTRSTQDV